MAKDKAPYKSVADKRGEQERLVASLKEQLNDPNTTDEQKPMLQERLNEAERRVRWYTGRKDSARFQAKATAEANKPATEEPTSNTEAPAPVATDPMLVDPNAV